jgi:hypothetical protein
MIIQRWTEIIEFREYFDGNCVQFERSLTTLINNFSFTCVHMQKEFRN